MAAAAGTVSPLEPAAEWIMERTPVAAANLLLEHLGPLAKPFALSGAAALALAAGGLLGVLGGRLRPRLALVLVPGGALLATWPLLRQGSELGAAVLAAVYAVLVLALLWRRPAPRPADPGRRRLLLRTAATVGAVAAASLMPPLSVAARVALAGSRLRGRLSAFAPPGARRPGYDLPGLTAEVTPLPQFYVMSKNAADPVLPEAAWALTVDGMVERPLLLSLDDLAALPRVERYVTMECVSNPVAGRLMSTGLFSGAALADLLAAAGLRPGAAHLRFRAPDGHREGAGVAEALQSGALVAYAMNGEWLSAAHGAPARLLLPGLYGFRSVKWLIGITVLPGPEAGHWEARGWTARAIHPTARVDLVRVDDGPGAGLLTAGIAFAGRRGVGAVDVRVNGGPWQPAELHTPPLGEATWVQWRARLPLAGGEVRVEARASDGRGQPQDEARRGQFPSGATGLHGLTVRL